MKHRLLQWRLLLAAVAFLLPSCVACTHADTSKVRGRHGIMRIMDKADALLGTDDGAALAALDSIDASALRGRKLGARYALLYSEALYKNYIPAPSDSLIMVAVRYYSVGNDLENRFLSFYQLGCIYSELGREQDALLAFTQAEHLSGAIKDDYPLGLLDTQLGNVFFDYFDFNRAEQYYRLAKDRYDSAGKDRHSAHAQYDVARCLMQHDEFESAHTIFIELQEWASTHDEPDFVCSCLLSRFNCSIMLKDKAEAMEEFNEYISLYGQPIGSSFALSLMSSYHLLAGNHSDVMRAIEQGLACSSTKNDSIQLLYNKFRLYEAQGDLDSALSSYKKTFALQNQNLYGILNQHALGTQKDYYRNLAENEMLKSSRSRAMVLSMIIFVLLVLSLLYVIHSVKKVRHEKEMQDYLLTIKELRLIEETNNDTINSLNMKVNTLFSRQYAELDRIFDTMIRLETDQENKSASFKTASDSTDTHSDTADKLYGHIRNKMQELDQKKNQDNIDAIIDSTLDNLMKRIKDSRFKMKEVEISILRFSLIGFSVRTISKIIGLTPKYIYQKRDRAIEKIGRLSPEMRDELDKLLK